MKRLEHIMMAFTVLLSVTVCNAQTKNTKTETVKIYGNCALCESTIEKAGNIKNEATVDWDKDTKLATISYDSLHTSKEQVLKRIALAGYDSDIFLAPDNTYAGLPGCCQYERALKIAVNMEVPKMGTAISNHSNHSVKDDPLKDTNPLISVFENYFALKNALVKSDGNHALTIAKELLISINAVKMDKLTSEEHIVWMKVLKDLANDTNHIAETKDPEHQRDYFNTLSDNMFQLMKVSNQETPTYYQHCPMANDGKGANWLSKEEAIKNPYYGSQMLSCGKTVETIK